MSARLRNVIGMLSADISDDLVRTGMLMWGACNMDAQFAIGIDLMIRGLDSYLGQQLPGSLDRPSMSPASG
jgi:hypothetical protein